MARPSEGGVFAVPCAVFSGDYWVPRGSPGALASPLQLNEDSQLAQAGKGPERFLGHDFGGPLRHRPGVQPGPGYAGNVPRPRRAYYAQISRTLVSRPPAELNSASVRRAAASSSDWMASVTSSTGSPVASKPSTAQRTQYSVTTP